MTKHYVFTRGGYKENNPYLELVDKAKDGEAFIFSGEFAKKAFEDFLEATNVLTYEENFLLNLFDKIYEKLEYVIARIQIKEEDFVFFHVLEPHEIDPNLHALASEHLLKETLNN